MLHAQILLLSLSSTTFSFLILNDHLILLDSRKKWNKTPSQATIKMLSNNFFLKKCHGWLQNSLQIFYVEEINMLKKQSTLTIF